MTTRLRVPLRIACCLLLLAAGLSSAPAQLRSRGVVSTTGDDANPCAPEAPCRTFSRALSVTQEGGEVVALDSGGYGTFTINKSISILAAPGAYAAIAVLSGDGIAINAPGDSVRLSRLSLVGVGGNNGIRVSTVGNLQIDDCTLVGLGSKGISVFGSAITAGVSIYRSTIYNCGTAIGIQTVDNIDVTVEDCTLESNSTGMLFFSPGRAMVRKTIFTDNGFGTNLSGNGNRIMLERCHFSGNSFAVDGGGQTNGNNSLTWVSGCTIAFNSFSINSGGGADIISFGNNRMVGNAFNNPFPATTPLQ